MHTHWIETLEFVQDFESSDDDEEEETWKIQMTVSRKGLASKTKKFLIGHQTNHE